MDAFIDLFDPLTIAALFAIFITAGLVFIFGLEALVHRWLRSETRERVSTSTSVMIRCRPVGAGLHFMPGKRAFYPQAVSDPVTSRRRDGTGMPTPPTRSPDRFWSSSARRPRSSDAAQHARAQDARHAPTVLAVVTAATSLHRRLSTRSVARRGRDQPLRVGVVFNQTLPGPQLAEEREPLGP
jgi:hypothetical protein